MFDDVEVVEIVDATETADIALAGLVLWVAEVDVDDLDIFYASPLTPCFQVLLI